MKKHKSHIFCFLKNNTGIKSALFCYIFLFVCNAIVAQNISQHLKNTVASTPEKSSLSYQIINAPESTFGYDILDHNRMMVHQPSIPGLPGNKGFSKKADAEKVAKLVISKISRNIMPPTITKNEMDSLHIKL